MAVSRPSRGSDHATTLRAVHDPGADVAQRRPGGLPGCVACNLYRYVRQRIPDAIVLTNPGTSCAPEYVARPASDVVCLSERDGAFEEFRPPAWASRFPASRFCVQVYHVDTEAQMRQALRRAMQLRVGYVYITDDQGPNPYDRLPSYWGAEVEAVRRANQPATR